MAERQIGQLSFADELVNDAARANAPLQRVSERSTGARLRRC